jgi:anti-sigma regulatory factor (Ser/Thr protein kinase)
MIPGLGGSAPHQHAVDFYDHDGQLAVAVARFVADGLNGGERVVVIATRSHLAALDDVLRERDLDPVRARTDGLLLTLDAADTLDTFMVDGSPDPDRFLAHVGGIVSAAAADGRKVRAFGEMVALLWDEGNVTAALDLESSWNDLAELESFSLLCAYPTTAFDDARLADVRRMCHLHSSVLPPSSYDTSVPGARDIASGQRSEVFLPVPEAVAALRRFVIDVLARWGEHDLVEDGALVASEMATNAVRHGDSPFRAVMGRSDGVVRLGVEDVGPGWPQKVSATLDDSAGRGLAIVEALAHRWGCDPVPDGKVIWAELTAGPAS